MSGLFARLRRIERMLYLIAVRLDRIEAALADPIFEQPDPEPTDLPANVVPFRRP